MVRAPARAAQFEYKAAHTQPIEDPIHVRQVQLWDQVAKETAGRLVVRIFPNGQLGSNVALVSQCRLGAVQFLVVGNSVYSDAVPAAGIDNVGFAFADATAAWRSMRGPLGDYVRKEFVAKGFYVPAEGLFDQGMRQMTSSAKPIRDVNDLSGFKIRVPPTKITVDLFQTLGASPVGIASDALYTSLQTQLVDGQETPLLPIESFHLFEVQRYLSITNHIFAGLWFVSNADAWKALPPEIQTVVERNVRAYSAIEHGDAVRTGGVLEDKLHRQGMIVNHADTQSMRSRLGPYYGRWKTESGPTLWSLLESTAGRLGQ